MAARYSEEENLSFRDIAAKAAVFNKYGLVMNDKGEWGVSEEYLLTAVDSVLEMACFDAMRKFIKSEDDPSIKAFEKIISLYLKRIGDERKEYTALVEALRATISAAKASASAATETTPVSASRASQGYGTGGVTDWGATAARSATRRAATAERSATEDGCCAWLCGLFTRKPKPATRAVENPAFEVSPSSGSRKTPVGHR